LPGVRAKASPGPALICRIWDRKVLRHSSFRIVCFESLAVLTSGRACVRRIAACLLPQHFESGELLSYGIIGPFCHFGGLGTGARSRERSLDPEQVAVLSPRRPDRGKTGVTLLKKSLFGA